MCEGSDKEKRTGRDVAAAGLIENRIDKRVAEIVFPDEVVHSNYFRSARSNRSIPPL